MRGGLLNNQDALSFYRKMAAQESRVSKIFRNNKDKIYFHDKAFLKPYIYGRWLDLGSGDGCLVNALAENAEKVTCVEMFAEFSQHITTSPHVTVYNQDLLQFHSTEQFDVITLFDSLEHFNDEQIQLVYQHIFTMLTNGGKLIIKQQYGIFDKVEKYSFSEELQHDYYINFQQLEGALAMLKNCGFTVDKVHDIYPAELNRWDNTHYYALVAQKEN